MESIEPTIPMLNMRYLIHLKKSGFKPSIFYDIGSSTNMWSVVVSSIFSNIQSYSFDASKSFKPSYNVCLSDIDNKEVNFYYASNIINSYYKSCLSKEDNCDILHTIRLDTFMDEQALPQPDLIKINTCGSELDIIKGGINAITKCKYLIINLHNTPVFEDAPLASQVGPFLESCGFEMMDALDTTGMGMIDYVFKNKNI